MGKEGLPRSYCFSSLPMLAQIASNYSNSIADTIETVYTSPTKASTVIESFTAANNSGVNASYKAYIVSSDGIGSH